MKFYITIEGIPKLKRSFLNLKLYSIISISNILKEYNYSYDTIDEYGIFIVNNRIIELINTYIKSKRIRGIIYSNEFLNKNAIENLFDLLEPIEKIRDIVLLDDYNVPKLEEFYPYFNEIIFFPSVKKVRIIECKPINKYTEWNK
ncbi:MAG TPA: hypothetical protein P5513_04175 [Candidatus Diapherotrites archaeon]|nr:hypothetical protein [Candidatus Diapherotrites archaeon]